MSQKRRASHSGVPSGSSTTSSKKTRKTISLGTKLDVLRHFDAGERAVDIGITLGLTPTTVRTIRSNADKIRASARCVTPLSATKISRSRSSLMENMERLLSVWIEDQNQRNIPLSLPVIQAKAKSLYDKLKRDQGEGSQTEMFMASRGWFDRFKKRFHLHNMKMSGEVASADPAAAKKFPDYLKKIIEECGYSPKQVFNVNETSLYWKMMPERTCISREEKTAPGFKAVKDRLTLLLGGNAAGDMKMKPLTVYQFETPRALKGFSKEHLPVIWRSNKKAWITGAIFSEWLTLYAVPAWKEYCAKENLDFKILLLIDDVPAHPVNLDDLCENVKVVFLPPNTTSLIQPMDQGAIAAFKAYYLRRTFDQLIRGTDGEGKPTIRQFWRDYNILKCINNIGESWAEVTQACMNGVWWKLWPECVNDLKGFKDVVPAMKKDILGLAKKAGFDKVEEADVTQLLQSHGEELTNEDLMQLDMMRAVEDEGQEVKEEPTHRNLTAKRLSEAFQMIEAGLQILSDDDPDRERSSKVIRGIGHLMTCYKEIYQEKKRKAKQPSLDMFFRVVTVKEEQQEEQPDDPRSSTSDFTTSTKLNNHHC
ncbi:tigger transposable element-derived protein 1 [Chelonia mydas]|uniref:tigger transposable element-derived protein 1 n=1 Tax=Chelonia mydas TaxID=8469 RepID=UPI0018A1D33F|nr:tigger transposable element-derived protein 1 [Chelonia mydas]XP_043379761.1 tigger transposable element-derived protein 1 [Chelonia mydas]XP_043379762.1 tigger transposable element-derived protein 1 [Chelonia mydas]XP_043379763.1 tigger transposable element-derived protein 1 [Chelonia mydas]